MNYIYDNKILINATNYQIGVNGDLSCSMQGEIVIFDALINLSFGPYTCVISRVTMIMPIAIDDSNNK